MPTRAIRDSTSAVLMLVLFACMAGGVFSRYVLNDPKVWLDELAIIAFIWVIFWPAAWLPNEAHVRFDLVLGALPRRVSRLLQMLGFIVVGLLLLWAVRAVFGYLIFLWSERTTVLQWPVGAVYACFGLFFAVVLVRSFADAVTSGRGALSPTTRSGAEGPAQQ